MTAARFPESECGLCDEPIAAGPTRITMVVEGRRVAVHVGCSHRQTADPDCGCRICMSA